MSIQRRTIFMEQTAKNGEVFHRFADWAMTVTTIGAMAEPFLANQRIQRGSSTNVIDFEDEMSRIDDISTVKSCDLQQVLGDRVHGGYQLPRVGR